jgi:hypothetical protein
MKSEWQPQWKARGMKASRGEETMCMKDEMARANEGSMRQLKENATQREREAKIMNAPMNT